MKKMKLAVCSVLIGAMLLQSGPVYAEKKKNKTKTESIVQDAYTFTSQDGVLSIQVPNPQWAVVNDPKNYFVVSDGGNVITISHLRNGEALPAPEVAGNEYAGVCQAYVSTPNEVFVIEGSAVKGQDLEVIMRAIGTIKVLKFDTKTSLNNVTAKTPQFTIREINATYYSTSDYLYVRNGFSTEDTAVGHLGYGEAVTVLGEVQKDGADYGWYKIQYGSGDAYASAKYLSKTKPDISPAEEKAQQTQQKQQTQQIQQAARESEEVANEPFTVYDRNWNAVRIYRTGDFQYRDYNGNSYSQVRGSMYYCDATDTLYSVDPNYWGSEDDPNRIDDDGDYGYEVDDGYDDDYDYDYDDDYDDDYDYDYDYDYNGEYDD